MDLKSAVQLARPKHWVKNIVVLFPIVLAMRISDPEAWLNVGLTTLSFCLGCSACYVFNDIFDRNKDKLHKKKKNRPIASGRISIREAGLEFIILAVASVAVAGVVNMPTFYLVIAYILLQLTYSMTLKHQILLDVICIAIGFVLRAMAGAVAISVFISPWLFVCTFTICLFMGFCKRRMEVSTLNDNSEHRPVLLGYSPELLTHLITISAGIAVVGFLLYATSLQTIERFGTIYMIYTLPVMVYAVFRFAMLSNAGSYMDPTELIFRDRPFQLAVVLWMFAMVCVVLWGHELQLWLANGC